MALAVVVATAASSASAQEAELTINLPYEEDLESRETPDPADPEGDTRLGVWGGPRAHVALALDLGFLFLRPKFYLGWGTPHRTFVAFEVTPLISGRGVGAYLGLRGRVPYGDLRVGARYFSAFTRSFLFAADAYDHLQVRDRSGPTSRYLSLESQLGVSIPIGSHAIVSEITGTYVTLVEPGFFVFEETLRVVLDPPFVWSASLGVQIRFGDHGEYYVQPGAEIVHVVDRGQFIVRAGLRAGVRLWSDLEVRLIAMPAILSPDSLGAAAGDTFLLGVRYRWATDRPDAP